MKREYWLFGTYIAILLLLNGLIFITPVIAHSSEKDSIVFYEAFSLTCHQKLSRSLCFFEDNSVSDCTRQGKGYVPADQKLLGIEKNGIMGYKFPVCSRDIGLYLGMLVGALAYPLFWKIESRRMLPAIVLIIGAAPFALDGTLQLVTSIFPGIIGNYESTNAIRMATGMIAGGVASVFVIPILNIMFGTRRKKARAAGKDLGKSDSDSK